VFQNINSETVPIATVVGPTTDGGDGGGPRRPCVRVPADEQEPVLQRGPGSGETEFAKSGPSSRKSNIGRKANP